MPTSPVPFLLLALGGCSGSTADSSGSHSEPNYLVASLVFGADGTTSYVSLLDTLEGSVDLAAAYEFSGLSDAWVHEGAVYIAETESLTVTRYAVEGGALVETGVVSFAETGLTDVGFWVNAFVAPTRAYYLNGADELIAWNPQTMEIEGTIPLPQEDRDGFKAFPGYADRAGVVRDGKLYLPLYWTDDTYFQFTSDSRIVVIDIATDAVEGVLAAPCPGIDYGALDEDGTAWFSSWVYAPGGAAVLDQPATCVVTVSPDDAVSVAFDVADLTGGREGGALRPLGDGRAVLSVLHDEEAESGDPPDVAAVTFGAHWRLWSVDLASSTATVAEAFDWSAGAQYTFGIDDSTYMLVPAGDYTSTTVYNIDDIAAPEPVLVTPGWSVRLFGLN